MIKQQNHKLYEQIIKYKSFRQRNMLKVDSAAVFVGNAEHFRKKKQKLLFEVPADRNPQGNYNST